MALFACNSHGTQEDSAVDAQAAEEVNVKNDPDAVASWEKKAQVAFAIQDLAARQGVEPGSVKVTGATDVTWRSGALGCPEPGMNYTQALVPGVWIMMWVGNTPYRYHAARGRQPFPCPADRAELPIQGDGAE